MQGEPQKIVSSKKENNVVYAVSNRSIYIISDGKVSMEAKCLNFEARSLEINEENNEIYVGASDGYIYTYDLSLNFLSKYKFHLGEVCIIRLSHNGKLVASGDNMKYIYVWNSATKEIECDRFTYHSSKVFDISWSSDDSSLISASLDKSVILWNLSTKTKKNVYSELDIEVVKASKFINDVEFVCGGHSCSVTRVLTQ